MEILSRLQMSQYGEGFFYRLDPRVKMVFALALAIVCPLIARPLPLAVLTVVTAAYMLVAGLGRVLLVMAGFFSVSMAFYLFAESAVFRRGPRYLEYLTLMLTMFPIMCGGLLLGMTTTTERLVTALGRLGVPAGMRYAVMVTIRYASMLGREIRHAILGMRVRGVMPGARDLLARPQAAFYRLFVPLLIRSFRVADRMGAAAEMLGLTAPANNLTLAGLRLGPSDLVFLGANIALMVVLWGISVFAA